jgi:hypothetical protein
MRAVLRMLYTACLCTAICIPALANKRKVLFIGNSYIFTNNMPQMLQQMATAMGDTLIFDQSVPGGYTLQQHSTDANTISKIFSQQWDVVVLQEQSQRPAFPPAQVAQDTYPYAHILDSMVRASGACTETMFFMTWGYKNGDPTNCAVYPVICTYEGMQQRLRESYLQMAADNQAIVAPVGAAWKTVRDSFPGINLYSPDNSHPEIAGSYLETCVFYASIFHKNPYGCTYLAGVPAADAAKLQRIAGRVTLDSIGFWQQNRNYVQAAFGTSVSNKTATFQNQSRKATSYSWTFGDGTTSTQTAPVHTYAVGGNYEVTLRAVNSCFTEVHKDTVHITGSGGVENLLAAGDVAVSYAGGHISIQIPGDAGNCLFELYAVNGQKLCSSTIQGGNNIIPLTMPAGLYVYTISQKEGPKINGKLVTR